MPLLDAAIAFTLTMLGLSSLVGMIQEWLHQARHVRSRQLETMLERWVLECFDAPADDKAADADQDTKTERANQAEGADREDKDPESEQEKIAGLSWNGWRRLGLDDLLRRVQNGTLQDISTRRLMSTLRSADDIQAIPHQELARSWDRLGEEHTAKFLSQAKFSATLLAVALAFGLNIDSLYLLEGYMSRGLPTDDREAATGPLWIGWEHFPNCPPTSTDRRCREYWRNAAGSAGLDGLDFKQREAINPLRHPRAALGLFVSDREPASTATHMSTDGGPPEDGASRLLPQVPPDLLGALSTWPVLAWFFGCLLTAILAGQGSPFWVEVLRRLSVTRDRLRADRVRFREGETLRSPAPPG